MSDLPDWIHQPIANVAGSVGLPADQLRLLICLLSAIPLGELHKRVTSTLIRHLFSIIVGVFYCFFVVGWGVLHVLFSSLIVYFMMQLIPRRYAPTLVYVLTLAWLSALHIYRMYVDYMGWSLDSTMILMIWTVKAVTFGYNYADGCALAAGETLSPRPAVHEFRAARAVTLPSLIEYLSYVFFFGGVLVGPCFEIKEYLEFSDGTMLKKYGLSKYPSTIVPALRCVGLTFLMYVGVFISGLYPLMNYVTTEAYASLPFTQRFVYFWIAITSSRFKYYFAWYFSEAGCVASGLGLNGVTRDEKNQVIAYKWDRVTNCNALAVETAPHLSGVTNNWNIGVNNWLKNYVYFRLEPSAAITRYIPAKTFSNLVTKATSAFWHGFYPSYYIFFISAWLINEMDDAFKASFEPTETEEKKAAKKKSWWPGPTTPFEVISYLLCFSHMNYIGTAFVLLRADHSFQFWRSIYFFGTWVPIVVIVVSRMFRPRRSRTTTSPNAPAKTVTTAVIDNAAPSTRAPEPDVDYHNKQKVFTENDAADDPVESPSGRTLRPRRSKSKKADD